MTFPPKKIVFGLAALALFLPTLAFAQSAPKIDSGDTAFMLVSAALVLFMTPGLAFFYGGLVRRKNVLSTMMHSYILMGVVGVQWIIIGYTLAFGPDVGHLVGNLDWFMLNGVTTDPFPDYAATIPHQLFMIYQAMFAIITPALISGTFAERIKFKSFMVFTLLWAIFVYDPLAHWVWGINGWLRNLGALDFAGGTVVHISSAVTAATTLIFVGKRRGFPHEAFLPHNLPFSILGVGMLWFGWFGFNAGSALAANGTAVTAFVTTNTATAAAMLGWTFTDWIRHGKPTVLGAVSGAVAGLVAITPACGFVTPAGALVIGAVGGVVCNFAVHFRMRLKLDDSLDVLGVHGVGGTLGAILTGVLCTEASLVHGTETFSRGKQVLVQLVGVGATYALAFIVSFVLLFVIDKAMGIRVPIEEEVEGLDLSQHGETGYSA